MLQAGIRQNVVPSEARGVLNIRLLPGNQLDPLIGKLKQLVSDPQIRFEIQPNGGEAAPSSSLETDLYATIKTVSAQEFAGAPVVLSLIHIFERWFSGRELLNRVDLERGY